MHERDHPQSVCRVSKQEYGQYPPVVYPQHDGEGDERDRGKDNIRQVVHQEALDPVVVADALEDVTQRPHLEEGQRHSGQFAQIVGDEAHVDDRVDMERHPALHEHDRGL